MEKLKSLLMLILPPVAAFFVAGLTQDVFVTNLATLAGIVTLVPIIAEWAKEKWNLAGATIFWNIKVMKLITWALSIGLTGLSYFVGWGFVDFELWQLAAYGVGAGLVANEYFTLATVKLLLEMFIKK